MRCCQSGAAASFISSSALIFTQLFKALIRVCRPEEVTVWVGKEVGGSFPFWGSSGGGEGGEGDEGGASSQECVGQGHCVYVCVCVCVYNISAVKTTIFKIWEQYRSNYYYYV